MTIKVNVIQHFWHRALIVQLMHDLKDVNIKKVNYVSPEQSEMQNMQNMMNAVKMLKCKEKFILLILNSQHKYFHNNCKDIYAETIHTSSYFCITFVFRNH